MPGDLCTSDPRAQQVARVETLLATFGDVLSTLSRSGAQLQHEIKLLVAHTVDELASDLARRLRQLQAENEQLKEALAHRAVIEQAKGVLMVRWECTAEEAFDQLSVLSRQRRRKVRDLAADVVRQRGRDLPVQPVVVPTGGRLEPVLRPGPPVPGRSVVDLRDAKLASVPTGATPVP